MGLPSSFRRLSSFFSLLLLLLLHQSAPALAVPGGGESDYNYGDALDKSLLFFEAQRSGKLPADQRVKWRADSGLRDGFLQSVDLVGGYYDAGDHVKFGLPMAYSMTMLAWGALEFRKEITHLNQMSHTLQAIKWGTDYFIKSHPHPDILWAQVGDGSSDHYCWERAEDMSTPRDAYKLDHEHPGSDLAGETAAALAAASLAFQPYNSSYSALLQVHAKQLFSFADRFRGQYDDSIQNVEQFYPSSEYSDELLWAAAWLYRATGDEYYLKYAVDNGATMGGTTWGVKEFSWDTKFAGVQILLSKVVMDNPYSPYTSILRQYQAKADYFACACLQKNGGYNAERTPGGLLYFHEWNNLQYVSSAAFLLTVYSGYLSAANAKIACPDAQVQPHDLLTFAKSQADYILGKNPKAVSYLVGYGTNYPIHVHHRGASIPSISLVQSSVGCVQGFDAWYNRPQGNPNVIYGALVGGPNKNDEFIDDRSSYEQTEPTLSGCAPLVGLFSKLQSSYGTPGSYHSQQSSGSPGSAGNYSQRTPAGNAGSQAPVEFLHSITNTWTYGGMAYYRHRVVIKNTCQKPIANLKLLIQNLSGPLWGLNQTGEKNTYELPKTHNVLRPAAEYSFVYIQGGPQAKVTVASYH